MGKAFNIAETFGEALRNVSNSDTGREQIEYIELDKLHSDPVNFYTIDRLEELASNIALIGLQQPLRVRPQSEQAGEYTIVSGHRRAAALRKLVEEGREDLATVPCIVERDDVSPEMQELRLIYANAATREMSPFDKAKQAERVTELLYKLKEQGVEFPGRMRDHVAEACQISASKLARIKVAREHLTGELARQFEAGQLSESAAYNLARLPEEPLRVINEAVKARADKNKPLVVLGTVAQKLADNIDKYMEAGEDTCRAHSEAQPCHHRMQQIVRSAARQYEWQMCTPGACCLSCYHKDDCSAACEECKDARKREKTKKSKDEEERIRKERAAREQNRVEVIMQCKRLLPYIKAAGLRDETKRLYNSFNSAAVGDVLKWAEDGAEGKTFYSTECVKPWRTNDLIDMAKLLHVSTDFILGLDSSVPWAPPAAAAPGWVPGATPPPEPGDYVVEFDLGRDHRGEDHRDLILARWEKGEWHWRAGHAMGPDMVALRWAALPADDAVGYPAKPATAGEDAGPWISVKDRLPPPGEDVVTVDIDAEVDIDSRSQSDGAWFYTDPLYWLPIPDIPELPKNVENDEEDDDG